MYIKSFHIEGFGPLQNFAVNDIPCGMAVFLGNNEAGKSSAMEFVRAMLMGIPTKRNALTQSIRNSKGGSMVIHADYHDNSFEQKQNYPPRVLNLSRYFFQNPSHVNVFDAHGNVMPDSILTEIMGGVSCDVYRMIYGFNLMELQNISNFHGSEVFNAILGASFGLGLRGPVIALETIQERMDALYKVRGKNSVLQKLFDAWNANKDLLDNASEEVKQFDLLKIKLADLEEKLISLRLQKNESFSKSEELQYFISVWGQWKKWADLQSKLLHTPSSEIIFPDNVELVLERILEQKKIKQKDLEISTNKLNEIENLQNAIYVNESFFEARAPLQKLLEDKGSYRQALGEITTISVKSEQFQHILDSTLKRLQDKWLLLDFKNDAIKQMNVVEMTQYLNKVPHDDDFLQELSKYEGKIIEFEAHRQSALTALDYANRDIFVAEEKRINIEEEIRLLLEKEKNGQASANHHLDAYAELSDKINLTKEAIRVLPEKMQRSATAFESWQRQINGVHLRNLKEDLDGNEFINDRLSNLRSDASSFTLLVDGSEKDFYLHVCDVVQTMLEKRDYLTPIAKKFLDEEIELQNIKEKIERIESLEKEFLEANFQDSSNNSSLLDDSLADRDHLDFQDEQKEYPMKDFAQKKESLDIKSRALHKLATINELRTQSIQDLQNLNDEIELVNKKLLDNVTNPLIFVPGALSIILGLPLFLLRILSGENIIYFSSIFSGWSGALLMPLWLPVLLLLFGGASIALPLSKRSHVADQKDKLEHLQKKSISLMENLNALRQEEASILLRVFDIKEKKQMRLYNLIHDSFFVGNGFFGKNTTANALHETSVHDDISPAPNSLSLDIKDASAKNEHAFEEQNSKSPDSVQKVSDSFSKMRDALRKLLKEQEYRSANDEKQNKNTHNNMLAELSLEDSALNFNTDNSGAKTITQNSSVIIDDNLIFLELSNFLQEELQALWGNDYAQFISEEQQNDQKLQNVERLKEFHSEKKRQQDLLKDSHELLESYSDEWEDFFKANFFNNAPEPKFLDAFFLRLTACETLQRRLAELNDECVEYSRHISELREIAKNDYSSVFADLQSSASSSDPSFDVTHIDNLQELLMKVPLEEIILILEKHIQEMRFALLKNNDISMRELALDSAMQAEKLAKEHVRSVEESLKERQALVDESYKECVEFLVKNAYLNASYEEKYIHAVTAEISEFNEKVTDEELSHENSQTLANTAQKKLTNKKNLIALVKQTVEMMQRFNNSVLEYNKIQEDAVFVENILKQFETPLIDLMKSVNFSPVYENSLNFLEAFEQFYKKMEQESAKEKELERLEQSILQIQQNLESTQSDIAEIDSNLNELLDLAHVENEEKLRDLFETQKQRDQIIKSSLDLEETFTFVETPRYLDKSIKAIGRGFETSQEISELSEIFQYFDENSKELWQKELSEIKEDFEILESQEQEIQNNCGALQAKCDALAQSTTLSKLRSEQLSIEEAIEENYETWRELSFAKEIITKARKQYELQRQPKVIAMASDFFASITDNVWEKIVVSLDDREIKVVDANGTLVSPELLSQGAKEQLYLSLRLAHIQSRLENNQAIPILMDDILVNFDKKRAEKTVETFNKLIFNSRKITAKNMHNSIEDVDRGQQILFYTCHEDTAKILHDKIADTKVYLVENKTVRPA